MRKNFLPPCLALFFGTGMAFGQASKFEQVPSAREKPTATAVSKLPASQSSAGSQVRTPPGGSQVNQAPAAQAPVAKGAQVPVAQASVAQVPTAQAPTVLLEQTPDASFRYWFGTEYLLWRIKDSTPSFPLVTTGDPINDPSAGALGSSSTQGLVSGTALDHHLISGTRFSLGTWLNQDAISSLEVTGFVTDKARDGFALRPGINEANQPMYVPVFLVDLGKEGKFFVSDPTVPLRGKIVMSNATRLWGTEVNGYSTLRKGCKSMDVLLGFRYLDLEDSLNLQAIAANDPAADIRAVLSERFGTRNQFFGGQVGARLGYRVDRLSLEFLGKIALGASHQSVDITGTTNLAGKGVTTVLGVPPGSYPGAIFAQSSNIGRHTRESFAVVPHLQAKLGCDIFPRVRATIGYDFLYWGQVVRPADQLDRRVNSAQSPLSPNFGTAGPALPAVLFGRSELWAQGACFGLEFRY